MRLITLQATEAKNWEDFINFWSKMYTYPSPTLYDSKIHKESFDSTDLVDFFRWKNGSILSNKKDISFPKKVLSKIEMINNFKKDKYYTIDQHLEYFSDISAVWKIFLLHLIKPKIYPIYDQHIHRAYAYIHKDNQYLSIDQTLRDTKKIDFYMNIYLPFINNNFKEFDLKKVDEAFFVFGKLLKDKNFKHIIF